MEMHPDFVNFYISNLVKEIEDLTKNKILLTTQLQYSEKIIQGLTEKLEKNTIKKSGRKEVNTSEEF
jgi:hypothetical protein